MILLHSLRSLKNAKLLNTSPADSLKKLMNKTDNRNQQDNLLLIMIQRGSSSLEGIHSSWIGMKKAGNNPEN